MTISSRHRISLRISHPALEADEISRNLDLTPTYAYTAGDQKMTPKGNVIPGKAREQSFWLHEFACPEESLEVSLTAITNRLGTKQEFFREVTSTGGSVEYFIGIFASDGAGFIISPDLMSKLADLDISLSFDLYGTEKADEA